MKTETHGWDTVERSHKMRYRRRIFRGKDTRQENRRWFIIGEMQVAGIQRAGNRRQDTGGGYKTPYFTWISA